MAVSGVPAIINDFNLYLSGNKLGGHTGEVKLPELETKTETLSGVGILGELDVPIIGHFGSIEQEIPFRCVNKDYFKLVDPTKSVELTLRGAIQYQKPSGGIDYMGVRVVFRGIPKVVDIGTAKLGGAMDSKITLELSYILIEVDGNKELELNKLSPTFKINGTDMLAKIKQLT